MIKVGQIELTNAPRLRVPCGGTAGYRRGHQNPEQARQDSLLGNGVCMWLLTEYAHLHYLYSKLVSALFVFLWNFLAKKYVLFHR